MHTPQKPSCLIPGSFTLAFSQNGPLALYCFTSDLHCCEKRGAEQWVLVNQWANQQSGVLAKPIKNMKACFFHC
jgi:hypothetical protein